MTTAQPQSYALALKQRTSLHARFNQLKSTIAGDGAVTRLNTFSQMIHKGCPAVNMTLAGCVRFLEAGHYLNIYDVIAAHVGARSGPAFEAELRRRLGDWYVPRLTFEKLLRFPRRMHYAALNLGGPGPDYGECCIRLGANASLHYATSFAGDPLRVVFDTAGNKVLADAEILERFATFEDRIPLTAIYNYRMLYSGQVIDEAAVVSVLDHRETLVEVHICNVISAHHVSEILLRRSYFEAISRRCLDYEDASPEARTAKLFDNVRIFRRFLQLVDSKGIVVKGARE